MEYVLCPNKQVCSQKYPSSSLFPRKYLPTLNTYQYVPTILTQVSTCTLRRRKEGWFARRSVMRKLLLPYGPIIFIETINIFLRCTLCMQVDCVYVLFTQQWVSSAFYLSQYTVVLIILSEIRIFVIQKLRQLADKNCYGS